MRGQDTEAFLLNKEASLLQMKIFYPYNKSKRQTVLMIHDRERKDMCTEIVFKYIIPFTKLVSKKEK